MEIHIKEEMDRQGIGTVELARRMGRQPQQISNVRAGDKNLSMNMLREVADALGVEPWRLLAPADVVARLDGQQESQTVCCPYCGHPLGVQLTK